jgi:triphosphoribosyl-dephospho-CoA synthase
MSAVASRRPNEGVSEHTLARRIATCAVRSLHAELILYPKPGLVSGHDSGAHSDMDSATFMRSVLALRRFFVDVAAAGVRNVAFHDLRRLGVSAETRMLRATRGVNTHRGAIFALGMLAAAAGRVCADQSHPTDAALRCAIAAWRRDLVAVAVETEISASHGRRVAALYGAAGARGEAAHGFPSVFTVALPALRWAIECGAGNSAAQLHAFFALLAHVEDTNVLYRGGPHALEWIRGEAAAFLAAGSVFSDGWFMRAETIHRHCRERGVSPGGCADLFSVTWFVHQLQSHV